MKALFKSALIVGCGLGGAVLSTVITIAVWNILVEPRLFQCTDSVWPFNEYWESLDTHASAGDKLSPGWTWEDLESVRALFIVSFFLLWILSVVVPGRMILRKGRQPNKALETIST